MVSRRIKSLSVAVFSILLAFFTNVSTAQPHHPEGDGEGQHTAGANGGEDHGEKGKFDANEVIFGHVMDASLSEQK